MTAKTNLESRIEGLEEGADAYIEKPFSMEYLRANVVNLLSNRERLRRHFIEFPFIKADAMAQTKADEMFISKLNEYVLRHLDNTDLQIDDIADAMNMGRSNFYRKLKGNPKYESERISPPFPFEAGSFHTERRNLWSGGSLLHGRVQYPLLFFKLF